MGQGQFLQSEGDRRKDSGRTGALEPRSVRSLPTRSGRYDGLPAALDCYIPKTPAASRTGVRRRLCSRRGKAGSIKANHSLALFFLSVCYGKDVLTDPADKLILSLLLLEGHEGVEDVRDRVP